MWLLAAKYQIEEENSVRNARCVIFLFICFFFIFSLCLLAPTTQLNYFESFRSLLQKGLRQNKESSVLWLEVCHFVQMLYGKYKICTVHRNQLEPQDTCPQCCME